MCVFFRNLPSVECQLQTSENQPEVPGHSQTAAPRENQGRLCTPPVCDWCDEAPYDWEHHWPRGLSIVMIEFLVQVNKTACVCTNWTQNVAYFGAKFMGSYGYKNL